MANNKKKKTRSETTAKNELAAFCAFWALLIAGILFLIQLILNAVGVSLGSFAGLINIIVAVMLGIAIALTAYKYVRGKSKGWKIAYWIMIVLYFVLAICGNIMF